jgi:F0F1-type ATP synthase delta subunit
MSLVHAYAKVLEDAEAHGLGKPFAEKMLSYMKAKGHLSLLPSVIKVASRLGAKKAAVAVYAKKEDAAKYKNETASAFKNLEYAGTHETVIDPNIVGGFTVRANGKIVDKSFRSALVSLYRSIVRS